MNRRDRKARIYFGKTMKEWAAVQGRSYASMCGLIKTHGAKTALLGTIPKKRRGGAHGNTVEYNGMDKNLTQWAKYFEEKGITFYQWYVRYGMDNAARIAITKDKEQRRVMIKELRTGLKAAQPDNPLIHGRHTYQECLPENKRRTLCYCMKCGVDQDGRVVQMYKEYHENYAGPEPRKSVCDKCQQFPNRILSKESTNQVSLRTLKNLEVGFHLGMI